jgi:hypothetical protein
MKAAVVAVHFIALTSSAILPGCYAAVGPTIGYRTGDGVTYGAEVDGATLFFAHAGGGFFLNRPDSGTTEYSQMKTTVYGSVGPGFYVPSRNDFTGSFAAGIGLAYEEKGDFVLGRGWGGPSFRVRQINDESGSSEIHLIAGVTLGTTFWNGNVWLHFSPQVGVGYMPVIR